MIHKPGKGWGQRKCFRPITLCNDMYKCLDGCLFYYMARETGTIQEPPPEEETTREPYLSETQRAYRRNRSTLDCLDMLGVIMVYDSQYTKMRAQHHRTSRSRLKIGRP